MKRSIFFGAIICALLAMVTSCSNPAGGGGTTPTYIGTKNPSSAKAVGDIVFNDGSATPYTAELTLTPEQKAAAIAVIFYVGTGLNSDVNGVANTTTSRTLGVGLKHDRSGPAWCPNSAQAYSTNITSIQCPVNGSAGELTFSKDKDGSDNLEQIAKFLKDADGVNDDTTTSTNYPAFYFAKDYSTEATNLGTYSIGWYLPTMAELFAIWKVKATVDAASALCGGSQFGDSYYWSSSQFASDDNSAYVLNFGLGDCNYGGKLFTNGSVCAIRAFN